MNIFRSMGKIKSAWEIALEKTEGIKIDKSKMKYQEDVEAARKAGLPISSDLYSAVIMSALNTGNIRESLE